MQANLINLPGNLPVAGPRDGEIAAKAKAPAVETHVPGTVDAEDLIRLQNGLGEHNISLKFSKDETTKALVVELIDDKTGEEIRQFPTEVSLKLAATFIKLQGQFVDTLK